MHAKSAAQATIWMIVMIIAAILFSFALACGMPFAALGALAALALSPRNALWLVGGGWLANQIIGFGFLGYPWEASTLAWGLALGLSAVAAAGAGFFAASKLPRRAQVVRLAAVFLAAWAAQQSVVFLASLILGGTASAFAPDVVWFIFWTNALAFGFLLGVQWVGVRSGWTQAPTVQALG